MMNLLKFHTLFFFFNDTATPEIYTLPLHDALPISLAPPSITSRRRPRGRRVPEQHRFERHRHLAPAAKAVVRARPERRSHSTRRDPARLGRRAELGPRELPGLLAR